MIAWSMGALMTFMATPADAAVAPVARSGHVMVADGATCIVIFGGRDSAHERLGDTWRYCGDGWEELPSGPSARSDATAYFDPAENAIVLFGGNTAGGLAGDTWLFRNGVWLQLTVGGPPARQLSDAAYDAHSRNGLLFGGQGTGRVLLNDTWQFTNGQWAEVATQTAPSPRAAHAMAFEPVSRRVIVVGGHGASPESDAWAFEGNAWKLLSTHSLQRLHHGLTLNKRTGRLITYGGFGRGNRESTTWQFDEVGWSELTGASPGVRAEHGMATAGAWAYVFGGITGQAMALSERRPDGVLWRLTTAGWEPVRIQAARESE